MRIENEIRFTFNSENHFQYHNSEMDIDVMEQRFGDYQLEKRYKNLERALKLASLKREMIKETQKSSSMSPGISSITADMFDSEANDSNLQILRMEKDSLTNMLSQKSNGNNFYRMTATSSVKELDQDRYLMPPPRFDGTSRYSLESKNAKIESNVKTRLVPQSNRTLTNSESKSPQKNSNYQLSNVRKDSSNTLNPLQTSSDNIQESMPKVFLKWKVMLNDQGQLIVKGTLKCGTVVRSKPISKRLNSTTVESIYKHLYYLHGNIYDNRCVLPDYVRGKFHNGFPDDWDNVHQLWKTFVHEGCKKTFHWPTRITDSDDDFMSETTELNAASCDLSDDTVNSESLNESCTLRTRSRNQQVNYAEATYRISKRDSFTQTFVSDSSRKTFRNVDIQTSSDYYNDDKENHKQRENIDTDCSYEENRNLLKSKLDTILNNIMDKKGSTEFIVKVIEAFDCLNDAVSQGSTDGTSNAEYSKLEHETSSNVNNSGYNRNINENKIISGKSRYNVGTKRTFAEMNGGEDKRNSDSDNEAYVGIPRILNKQILQPRSTLIKRRRRKIMKVTKDDVPQVDVSFVKNDTTPSKLKPVRNTIFNDSSVSIIEKETEEETGPLKVTKYKNPTQSTITNRSPRMLKKPEWEALKSSENSVSVCNTTKELCNSFSETENRNCKGVVTKEYKNALVNVSGIFNERKKDRNDQYQDVTPYKELEELPPHSKNLRSKISKRIMTNSTPVNEECMRNDLTLFLHESSINSSNEKQKNKNEETVNVEKKHCIDSIQKASPPKVSHTSTNSNGKSSICNKKDYETRTENLQGNTDDRSVKPLTAWVPKVIYEPELQLIFEGNLLNESGFVTCRNLKTAPVLRRISPKLIETVHHEFYELIGDVKDTKHGIPKEVLKLCRYGCPARIQQFCQAWKANCSDANKSEKKEGDDTVPLSSKGRRLFAPQNYWTGERAATKEDIVKHNHSGPGNYSFPNTFKTPNSYESPGKGKRTKNPRKQSDSNFKEPEASIKKQEVKINQRKSADRINNQLEGTEDKFEYNCDVTALKDKLPKLKERGNTFLNSTAEQISRNHEAGTSWYTNNGGVLCNFYGIAPESDALSDDQVSLV